ncbi:hypothetical protein MHYP_G00171060 [Metynnis hypsauchen]
MEESDKSKTAFVCPVGFWEFNRMPQGITNAPSTFQRLMEKCMGDINLKEVLVFLDDIIVFSRTLEEHEARLLHVLSHLRENGLKLSPAKCKFFQTSVCYLGHVVGRDRVHTDPGKISALTTWPVPKNLKELKSFLGFSGYYRRFIQDYSKIVKPLNDLTAGYPPLRKGTESNKANTKRYFNPKDSFGARWTPACQAAFELIIKKLTSAPVLAFADPKLPYILHTNASTTGLGAALYQEQEGQMRVIAYARRGLSCSEARYPGKIISMINAGEQPLNYSGIKCPLLRLMLKEWRRLELKNGILYRNRQCDSQPVCQLVLPESLRPAVLENLHDDMGHLGIERTLDLVRSRFYWPKLASDVERKVKSCGRCIRRKSQPEKAAPLVSIQTTRPMELVCMDFLSLEPDSHNTKDILVITDHFTKYSVAIPTKDQKATTIAKCLWEHFLVHYGFPERLHSDQGRDFESRVIKELCAVIGTRKVRTSPYHPRGNPVERYNRTLLSMLGTLKDKDKSRWRDFVKPLSHAYNCTKNEVTSYSPYELMFGRQPRLPIDIAFGLPVQGVSSPSHSQYVRNLRTHLMECYHLAMKNAQKVAGRNKRWFDKLVRESTLEEGDCVLVRNVRVWNKHKLADRWESAVYKVLRQLKDIPVYVVQPEGQDGPICTLHRDLLLPCGMLTDEADDEPIKPKSIQRPRTRQNPVQSETEVTSESESDGLEFCQKIPLFESQFTEIYDILPQTLLHLNK